MIFTKVVDDAAERQYQSPVSGEALDEGSGSKSVKKEVKVQLCPEIHSFPWSLLKNS